jgi:hypothetical protein
MVDAMLFTALFLFVNRPFWLNLLKYFLILHPG